MPVPFAIRRDLEQVILELRRIADLLERLGEKPGGNKPHPELAQIAKRFARVGDTLGKSIASGRGVTAAQIKGIATNLEAAAAALRRNA